MQLQRWRHFTGSNCEIADGKKEDIVLGKRILKLFAEEDVFLVTQSFGTSARNLSD